MSMNWEARLAVGFVFLFGDVKHLATSVQLTKDEQESFDEIDDSEDSGVEEKSFLLFEAFMDRHGFDVEYMYQDYCLGNDHPLDEEEMVLIPRIWDDPKENTWVGWLRSKAPTISELNSKSPEILQFRQKLIALGFPEQDCEIHATERYI